MTQDPSYSNIKANPFIQTLVTIGTSSWSVKKISSPLYGETSKPLGFFSRVATIKPHIVQSSTTSGSLEIQKPHDVKTRIRRL
jgi:hypothetical protein